MTMPVHPVLFADAREAADLAAFLGRLLHYDRAAAVRLQAAGGALAVFGRPPSFDVLAIRTARLAGAGAGSEAGAGTEPGAGTGTGAVAGPGTGSFDVTVSAGEFLETLDPAGGTGGTGTVPRPVTGPPWAGMLPPRGPWREVPGLPGPQELRTALSTAVGEFRSRDGALPEERRTRTERDLIGREIWSRPVGGTPLPLRAVHAAHSLGFLRPQPGLPVHLLSSGSWLRLRTPYGSVALRTAGSGGLGALQVSVGRR
ncbi:hypothetical protein [Streptomyces sp. AM 2-1-1]|uniref:hypothetical protein n=1 Tax=Streptomyces sp. AM 2-1-1 TaxID=3028709 RepID=UPI0023B8DB27|nr:hypothetical protein [Streptomyces sp. AM 2-1-1]WEH41779.1 hypothetical protein PZB77_21060 [Streptomyces sp. AM 2-1-1]